MLKINHILYSDLGGVLDVCKVLGNLDKATISKSSFILVGPKRGTRKVSATNQKTHFVKTYRFFSFFYFISILKVIVNEKPDLIFLHNYQIIPVLLFKFLFNGNLKIVYIDHKAYNLKNYKDFIISSLFKSFINSFVVLNKDNYSYYSNYIKINTKKIHIIPNAINNFYLNNYKKKKQKSFLIVGMAGRINKAKHHELIIDSLQHNILKKFHIKGYFAGDGERVNFLKKQINNKNNFKFFGILDSKKLKKWYMSLDIYIQSTKGEGHSTSILQAMGMNLPILASNVSGIRNFLCPKKNIGIVFENNPKSLANKIKHYIQLSSYKKNKIIRSQKNFILSNYSETKILKEYKKVIKKLYL